MFVNISGERTAKPPQRFTTLHLEYVICGHAIRAKAVEQAIGLSKDKCCSALASLNAAIEHSYRIVEEIESNDARKEAGTDQTAA